MSGDHLRGEASVVAGSIDPVTVRDITSSLEAAGMRSGEVVIVHASLSELGWVVGGAHAVVEALLGVAGSDGSIIMPAQTGMTDPSSWENPPVPEAWWPAIREHWPPFDPRLTPLRGMGAVVECLHRHPRIRHSGHPSSGFIGLGPAVDHLLKDHPLERSFGEASPLARLYEAGARIVLIGVDHSSNTALHLAEERADYGGKRLVAHGAAVRGEGGRRWITYHDLDYDSDDFAELGRAFVSAGGREGRASIGTGQITTYDMREIVDFGATWIETHR